MVKGSFANHGKRTQATALFSHDIFYAKVVYISAELTRYTAKKITSQEKQKVPLCL